MMFSWKALTLAFVVTLLPAHAAIERKMQRIFPAAVGATLKIDTAHGGITVQAADQSEIRVIVRLAVEAKDEAQADERLDVLDLDAQESAGNFAVTARFRSTVRWAWQTWPPVALSYEVTVPRSCNLDLSTRSGDITVGPLRGNVNAVTDAGTIFIGENEGSVVAKSVRGDVSVTACTGVLRLMADSGNLLVGRAGGVTRLDGTGGTIEVQSAHGRVEAEGINADVRVNFTHPLYGDSTLNTSGGDVRVGFDTRCTATVSARASVFGKVRLRDLALAVTSGENGASRVDGLLNGGGPAVTVNASGGNVRLDGVEP